MKDLPLLVAHHSRGCKAVPGGQEALAIVDRHELPVGCSCAYTSYAIRYRKGRRNLYVGAGTDRAMAVAQFANVVDKLIGPKPRRKRSSSPRDLYFARSLLSSSYVKIGVSSNVEQRMRDLLAEEIYVIKGGERLEAEMHRRFAHLAFLGEWFHYEGDLRAYLESR